MEQGIVSLLQSGLDFLNNCFTDVRTHLMTTPADFGGGAAWSTVETVNRGIQGIGYGLLILFFLMSFFKTTSSFKDVSLQQMIGWIVRFILVKIMIDYGIQILNFAISVSMGVNREIFSHAGSYQFAQVPKEVTDMVSQMQNAQWYERLGAVFETLPMYVVGGIGVLVIWISGVIMVVTVYLRFFKIYIYSALAPIPLSTFGSQETSQVGKHFLKSYAAACLEICVIALAIVIFNAMAANSALIFPSWGNNIGAGINAGFWTTLMNYLFQLILQVILLVTVVASTNRFIREMLGV